MGADCYLQLAGCLMSSSVGWVSCTQQAVAAALGCVVPGDAGDNRLPAVLQAPAACDAVRCSGCRCSRGKLHAGNFAGFCRNRLVPEIALAECIVVKACQTQEVHLMLVVEGASG